MIFPPEMDLSEAYIRKFIKDLWVIVIVIALRTTLTDVSKKIL